MTRSAGEVIGDRDTVLVVSPHMDDEVLSCGGLIGQLASQERVHIVHVTDGSRSPSRAFAWMKTPADLPSIRTREALQAARTLGIPSDNVRFLGLPEGRLGKQPELAAAGLAPTISAVQPTVILVPFRYDRHPDHLAVRDAALAALARVRSPARVLEYFVYYRWRLLRGRDIRKYVRAERLIRVDAGSVEELKRRALQCYESQTTKFYTWQRRPVLTEDLVDAVSASSEFFVHCDASLPGASILTSSRRWIRVVHRFEPLLKRAKDRAADLLHAVAHPFAESRLDAGRVLRRASPPDR